MAIYMRMTKEQFKKDLTIINRLLWRESGEKIIITNDRDGKGIVFIVGYDKIPFTLEFENPGSVHLITSEISEDTVFRNSGSVYMDQKEIPEGVVFANDGSITLRGLDYIHGGVKFQNSDSILFENGFPKIAPGVEIKNKGMIISPDQRGDLFNSLVDIEGISSQRVMNFIIDEGLLDRR